jgi:hypothetical protein
MAHAVAAGACALAWVGVAAGAARQDLRPPEPPHAYLPAGRDAQGPWRIDVDTVRRIDDSIWYSVVHRDAAAREDVMDAIGGDCRKRFRAVFPRNAPPGARVPAPVPERGSREWGELAAACALPDGPRTRWFTGVVVSRGGALVASRLRTSACTDGLRAWVGGRLQPAHVVTELETLGLSLVRLDVTMATGVPMSLRAIPLIAGDAPVTALGVLGVSPRIAAGVVPLATHPDDAGWPQAVMLDAAAVSDGLVWDRDGAMVGVLTAPSGRQQGLSSSRLIPADQLATQLKLHDIALPTVSIANFGAEAALLQALRATLPLECARRATR